MKYSNNDKISQKTVAFHTLGCKVNSYETEGMQKLFRDSGFEILNFDDMADIYVVNTCTVTNLADRKSRQMLRKARRMNKNAIIVAAGCYVQAYPNETEDIEDFKDTVDIIVGNNHKQDIVKIVMEYTNEELENKHEYVLDIGEVDEFEELGIETISEKTRASIKIQDGCNQFCSYCIIPYTRGRVRSRRIESVIKEVQVLVENNYKEVVLTGIHVSSYGMDFADNLDKTPKLLDLIIELSKIKKLERIRLSSLEPRIITEEFAKTLSENPKLCPHFHLSLQSGCDKTLKRMNRKYTTDEYKQKCDLLRKHFKNPAITTDVIVGFPGETKEEFNRTVKFIKEIEFSQMHIFKYSVRKGTVAERLADQVDNKTKKARSKKLIKLAEETEEKYMSTFIDKVERVLVEEQIQINDIKYNVGHNERYVKIAFEAEEDLSNQIVYVKVKDNLTNDIMIGKILE